MAFNLSIVVYPSLEIWRCCRTFRENVRHSDSLGMPPVPSRRLQEAGVASGCSGCCSLNQKQRRAQWCLSVCAVYGVVRHFPHPLAYCGFTHTAKVCARTCTRTQRCSHNLLHSVCGCQGTARPGSCSPVSCFMMASHTPHLQCSQLPWKFNGTFKGACQECFGFFFFKQGFI